MITKITPEMAQKWIDSYVGAKVLGIMRPVRPWWVTYLANQMKQGLFSPVATVVLAKVGDQVCIVNGNHTLRAIVQSGVTITIPVEKFTYQTDEEVRHLYATADHGLARTRTDSYRAYDVPHLIGVTHSDARSLGSAVLFMMNDYGRIRQSSRKVSDTDLLAAMKPWIPAFGKLIAVTGNSHGNPWYKRVIRRSSVCAIALITMQYQHDMAHRFWGSVIDGTNFAHKQSPALRLREYLTETIPASGRGNSGKIMEQQDLMAKKVAHCWNLYYLNKPLKLLRVSNDKPLEILGRDSTSLFA